MILAKGKHLFECMIDMIMHFSQSFIRMEYLSDFYSALLNPKDPFDTEKASEACSDRSICGPFDKHEDMETTKQCYILLVTGIY